MPSTAAQLRSLSREQALTLPALLQALWSDAQGDWQAAHVLAQDVDSPEGAWVHAYLHRREGDAYNAAYWYRRAGKPVCTQPLAAEWDAIASSLLHRQPPADRVR